MEEKAARGIHEKASAQKKALIIALEVRTTWLLNPLPFGLPIKKTGGARLTGMVDDFSKAPKSHTIHEAFMGLMMDTWYQSIPLGWLGPSTTSYKPLCDAIHTYDVLPSLPGLVTLCNFFYIIPRIFISVIDI